MLITLCVYWDSKKPKHTILKKKKVIFSQVIFLDYVNFAHEWQTNFAHGLVKLIKHTFFLNSRKG